MAEFAYTPQPARIPKFFQHIQGTGVPTKVTQKYLETAGFKSKNDRYLISLVRRLGFTDGSNGPIDAWRAYRRRDQANTVMAAAIKATYAGLFDMYEDAWRKDKEAIHNYFKGEATGVGDATVDLMVRTFTTLCQLADFGAAPEAAVSAAEAVAPRAVASKKVVVRPTSGEAPLTVNLNIQLQLPATDDASIYDKFFEAMKKHLLS